jgi:hypothetical protein
LATFPSWEFCLISCSSSVWSASFHLALHCDLSLAFSLGRSRSLLTTIRFHFETIGIF